MEGGAAMLVALRINHHNAIAGKMFRSPLVRNSLRVEVCSYVLLAMAKRAEEHRP